MIKLVAYTIIEFVLRVIGNIIHLPYYIYLIERYGGYARVPCPFCNKTSTLSYKNYTTYKRAKIIYGDYLLECPHCNKHYGFNYDISEYFIR